MADRHALEKRIQRYMEQRARVEAPPGLDARLLEAVRSRSGRPRRIKELVLAGAVTAVLTVAAVTGLVMRDRSSAPVGGVSTPPSPADPCLGARACLVIEVDVSGAELLSGEQRRPVTSCAGILSTDAEGTLMPRLMGELDGHSVSSFLIVPTARPGTYDYSGSPSYPSDVLDVDGRHYVDAVAGLPQTASGTVVIGANGSGSYILRGLLNPSRPSQTASVEVSWRCATR